MKLIITDIENFGLRVEGPHRVIKPGEGSPKHCIGCFGCWIKTPGICVIHDGFERTGIDLSKCTEFIVISRCCYGCTSPFVKNVIDRAISYVHPDLVIREGEMHHRHRYDNKIELSYYFYGPDILAAEKDAAKRVARGNAINFDGTLKHISFHSSESELEGIIL